MYWENLVFDASNPHEQGIFWEELFSAETLSDNSGGYETRLQFSDNSFLDLCFPTVSDSGVSAQRLFPVVIESNADDYATSAHYLAPRRKLQDRAGRDYLVVEPGDGSGRFKLLAVEVWSADPVRDIKFWSALTGWKQSAESPTVLQHPNKVGPLLGIVPQQQDKADSKSSIHLDLRLEPDDDVEQIVERVEQLGGSEFHHEWGEIPWRVFLDPSGNEFCILPAPTN
ncbi:VOC family protein [Arthrobacter sp. S41]|uniref:VOC family protein n=1 Tax=Micrococcaceae TaxID=1268 RepID=UPI001036C6CA|nr:VOC family protein [Arthrobacter sp. S41]TAP27762.1 VOC family protein [Arthrobacter sp. S41]